MSLTPNDDSVAELLIDHREGEDSERRNYFQSIDENGNFRQVSKWVYLEKDQPYFVNATHQEVEMDDFFLVSVEIELDENRNGVPKRSEEDTTDGAADITDGANRRL